MKLTGYFGDELTAIKCDAINGEVVTTDNNGNQIKGPWGETMRVMIGVIPNAPEACPLNLEASTRALGDFAICSACPHAILVGEAYA